MRDVTCGHWRRGPSCVGKAWVWPDPALETGDLQRKQGSEVDCLQWIENEVVVLFTWFVLCNFMSDPRFSCIVTITWLLWRNVTWRVTIWPLVWISKSDTCDTCAVTHLVTWTRDWCWCCEGSWRDWPSARLILRQLAVFSGSEMDY